MATETDGVISEPISVFVEAAVAVTSGEENDNDADVHEDKGSKSVVDGVKDGDDKEEEDDEYHSVKHSEFGKISNTILSPSKQSEKCGSLSTMFPSVCEGRAEGIEEKGKKGSRSCFMSDCFTKLYASRFLEV
uniref:Uncharacterized protein n=1 Tax=Brassica campestris TaxID=3711 RepID=M4F018_BRACM